MNAIVPIVENYMKQMSNLQEENMDYSITMEQQDAKEILIAIGFSN